MVHYVLGRKMTYSKYICENGLIDVHSGHANWEQQLDIEIKCQWRKCLYWVSLVFAIWCEIAHLSRNQCVRS